MRSLLLFLISGIAFTVCTAQQANSASKKNKYRIELEFSVQGGFYDEEIALELLTVPGAKIYYTLDGTLPTRSSDVYTKPLHIRSTTVVRAIARYGRKKSKHQTHSFFINEPASTIPVVSMAIPPEVLFDPETGLFMKGSNVVDSVWSKPGANFWSRRETVINAEIFEVDGNCEYNNLSGFRLFGGMSRLFPQKSMTIVARKRYGQKRINHQVFGEKGERSFKFLVLRNSGSDWGKSHFRDALMTSLLDDWDIEKQDYRPAHVYINGKYWGIYNIREKINRYFIADHYDVDKDSIDLMEHRYNRKRGSRKYYRHLISFLEGNDIGDPANYAYVQSLMDVDNFMNYQIAQIYFDNQDAGGNIKFWRPQQDNGRWRWILYDTDWGFGLHDDEAFKNNSLAFHTQPNGPSWPNPPWSTFILRKLLENRQFRNQFINRFADHINTTFASERVVELIEKFYKALQPEMSRHLERWRLSETTWHKQVQVMKTFGEKRPAYAWAFLQQGFDLGQLIRVEVGVKGGGRIVINDNVVVVNTLKGNYFEKLPVRFKAVPNFGYRFSHWEGIDIDSDMRAFTIQLSEPRYKIKAVFVKAVDQLAGKIMINEISPNNKQSGDWVELFNKSEEPVNLKNWIFTDSKNEFVVPDAIVPPSSYLILCENLQKFRHTFPDRANAVGSFNFGLNKHREVLNLYTSEGAAVDSISYNLEPIDSTFTLGLLLPFLDNSDTENWEINYGAGSPLRANPYYLESRIKAKQERAMMFGGVAGMLLVFGFLLIIKKGNQKIQEAK